MMQKKERKRKKYNYQKSSRPSNYGCAEGGKGLPLPMLDALQTMMQLLLLLLLL